MAKIFYQADCDINVLKGKTVAIIGYGSQGHAHALNLHESGVDVVVGLYEGSKSWAKAEHFLVSHLSCTCNIESQYQARVKLHGVFPSWRR